MADDDTDSRGPSCWINWRAFGAQAKSLGAFEVPLFSDASVTGEIRTGLGPYQFLNPVAAGRSGELRPIIYLRVEEYAQPEPDPIRLLRVGKTDDSSFVGGNHGDEIAALVSLVLGMRCKAGDVTRQFDPGDDPRGRPAHWMMDRNPILPHSRGRIRIPDVLESKSLDQLHVLGLIPSLAPDTCVDLLRAAKLYQDALWLAEAEPNLSWIMLVSAVEVAAAQWRGEDDPVMRFRAWGVSAALEPILHECGGEELIARVANVVAPSVGSSRSFVDFLMTFCPEPPERRPPEAFQVPWDRREVAYKKIYGLRSRALHGGKRFPPPMSEPPFQVTDAPVPAETPIGLASAQEGGAWERADMPMLLHTFEAIVRRALGAWLRSFG